MLPDVLWSLKIPYAMVFLEASSLDTTSPASCFNASASDSFTKVVPSTRYAPSENN